MHKSIKLTLNALLLLTLSACASTGHKKQATKNINSPPAIDVPYQEVSNNIKDNVGVNVRWGGEIISAKKAGEATELTVVALPLSKRGRPLPQSVKQNHNERFIVKVTDYEDSILRKYLTVYGQVTGAETLVNGPKTKIIPVVTAINSKEWKSSLSSNRRGYAYYDLGYRAGHFGSFGRFGRHGFGPTRFGFTRFGSSRFGHRGFNRFGKSFYGHRFYRGSRW